MVKFSALIFIVIFGIYEEVQAACPTIINRQTWGAQAAKARRGLAQIPPPYVVIHHTETPPCESTENCKRHVKNIQDYDINSRGWVDIGYNFLIGGDGHVYEGRGWGMTGSHLPQYNSRSLGISMIGNFENNTLPSVQMEALKDLIACAVEYTFISSNYHLIGHRQGKATACPGDALYNEITMMPHWNPNPN